MLSKLRFLLQQIVYDVSAGLLLRPGLWTVLLAALAIGLGEADARAPPVLGDGDWRQRLVPGEAAAAQMLLGTIAGSIMTVVSIIYSSLLMSLTLASAQFSPRILAGFLRDRVSQHTLGLFVGTFTYCLLVLRSVHGEPRPFVPALSICMAIALALVCLATLVYFIHHIAQRIQANHIIDHIARETEEVIDAVFPPGPPAPAAAPQPAPSDGVTVAAPASGYIQLVHEEGLLALARRRGLSLYVHRGVGNFVAAGAPLVTVSPTGALDGEVRSLVAEAFDIGPIRTMQQDVEFGLRQIVDIGLKAISPAVNDPSTAVTCIDHLGRLLGRAVSRRAPPEQVLDGGGRLLLHLPRTSVPQLLDLAFQQLRQYGQRDMAVALRVLRALGDVAASAGCAPYREDLRRHGDLLAAACAPHFTPEDRGEFERRLAALRESCGAGPA